MAGCRGTLAGRCGARSESVCAPLGACFDHALRARRVHKFPATTSEAMATSLMGFFQKRKFRNFLQYIGNYEQASMVSMRRMERLLST